MKLDFEYNHFYMYIDLHKAVHAYRHVFFNVSSKQCQKNISISAYSNDN